METKMQSAPRREIGVVTAEIRTLTGQAQHMILNYAMEIGRRLVEAKSLLPHGEWGNWLKNEVEFSQSTANNFMKIFTEYSDNQLGFETKSNSQALGNLSYTKALALLAIPAEEREAFAEEVKADEISTRELAEAIKAKEAAEAAAQESEDKLEEAEERLRDAEDRAREAEENAEDMADRAAEKAAEKERAATQSEIARLKTKATTAEAEAIARKAEADNLRKQWQDAVQKLKNPPISDAKKAEISAEAVKKAEDDFKKKLEAAEKAAEDAKKAAAKAEQEAADALQKRSEAEKALAVADPDTVLFRELFSRVQKDIIEAKEILSRIEGKDAGKAGKLREALGKVLKGAID